MENKSRNEKSLKAQLTDFQTRLESVLAQTAKAWIKVIVLPEVPDVLAPGGTVLQPAITVLTEINKTNVKLYGLLRAMSMVDPLAIGIESEQDRKELVEEIERILQPIEVGTSGILQSLP
jgi:hypothetical protein